MSLLRTTLPVVLLAAGAIAGCEAPLDLDAVERSRQAAIRRSDVLQAASASGSSIVVVGSGGLVIRSADAGKSWQRAVLHGWPYLIDVSVCSDGMFAALAYEGEVWVSRDQGATWAGKSLGTDEQPQSITCDPAGRLWVVGSLTTIWASEDAGESWNTTSLDEDVILTEIQFINVGLGYITGEFGTVMRTEDGGRSWERMPPLPDEFYPQDMYFEDREHGWVAGLAGVILRTDNGGRSWQPEQTGSLVTIYGLEPLSGRMFAVGGEGTILRLDGGQWHAVNHGEPIRFYLRGIQPLSGDRLLVLGPNGTLKIFAGAHLLQDAEQPTGKGDQG